MPTSPLRRELLFLAAAMVLLAAGAVGFWLLQPPVLTVAVGPNSADNLALFHAFADTLVTNRKRIRLVVQPYDDVRQSAAALEKGTADLAIVRPDVAMPSNALTLAILRNQAMIVASPVEHGIHDFRDLANRRVGLVEHHEADVSVLETLAGYYGLTMRLGDTPGRAAAGIVRVIRLTADELPAAFADRRIDAVASIMVPASPEALHIVQLVEAASPQGHIAFVNVPDGDAITQRYPLLQGVTIPSGIFGGHPLLPRDDVKTVGSSYRLVSRATLDRTVAGDVTQYLFELRGFLAARSAAADYMTAPDYDSTAAATSARLALHPGAIDYYERDQQSFLDRYEDLGYVVASLLGGFGSAAAWAYHRFTRGRRQRIDEVLERLAAIKDAVRGTADAAALQPLIHEIDDLASEVVQIARHDENAQQTIGALTLAVHTVRAAAEARQRSLGEAMRRDAGGKAA
jgi:TRAP-type uncharacterized transport system substrate-binding protein